MSKRHWFGVPCNPHVSHAIMTSEVKEVTCKRCLRIMVARNIKKSITNAIKKAATPL